MTVSCSTTNNRTFLNDELLLCKWLLTDTVSAWQSPAVRSTVAEAAAVIVIIFMIARSSQRGEEGRGGRGLRWMSRSVYCTVNDLHMKNIACVFSLVVVERLWQVYLRHAGAQG